MNEPTWKWTTVTADNVWPGDMVTDRDGNVQQVESVEHDGHMVWIRFLQTKRSTCGDTVMCSYHEEDKLATWKVQK